ncbi:hypothetical protein [Cellulomonas rhizosphaerae]|uniref:Uncharacterized protein n=1 Tax=Cellulomonas rhizosphaerae TaxID=2293719 RepID=A0A413RJD8_9CELL|nr:hypothetical protein [Cellulomonas rhizosphaerae]RHA38703.1 hypothetical protein D1825_13290 [Cellulomonas rhizosphaerae]
MVHLSVVSAPRELPRAWDGRTVIWGPWHDVRTSLVWHLPPADFACPACGLIEESPCAVGTVRPLPGETTTVQHEKRLPSGRTYWRTETRAATPVLALFARRCTGCGHDQVHDRRTDEVWDLDDSDYGPEGSTHVEGSLW